MNNDFSYHYNAGKRVGLLARVTDAHDKGNIVMLIEGTDVHVQLSEAALLNGVDLIHAKIREKHEAEAAAAAIAAAAEATVMAPETPELAPETPELAPETHQAS